jgi:transposase
MRRSTTESRVVTYAGIDYHKKFSMVSLGDENGKVISIHRVTNDEQEIREFFSPFPALKCVIESCRGYEWFVDLLKEIGLDVQLCNAHEVKLIAHSRCKTDKVDSRILMELLAIDFLPVCYQPTAEQRALRERLRWRCHLVRNTTRLKLRVHALLDKENIGLKVGPKVSSAVGRELLRQTKLRSPGRQELLEKHLALLDHLDQTINAEDAWIKKAAKANADAQLLMTIPGIGAFSALFLIAELGDVTRFKRSAQIVNFAGLAPRVDQSGDVRRTGSITKAGSSLLRWILVQDAWQALRCYEFRCHFASVSKRCGRHGAIVSVARKLLEVVYRVLRDKKPFDANLLGAKHA